jgi:hypothetical protein
MTRLIPRNVGMTEVIAVINIVKVVSVLVSIKLQNYNFTEKPPDL